MNEDPEYEEQQEWARGPRLVAGLLTAWPLFVAYELALWSEGLLGQPLGHNGAELAIGWVLRPVQEYAFVVRWVALVLTGLAAWHWVRVRELRPLGLWARGFVEGLGFALVLGPLLFLLLGFFDAPQLAHDLGQRAPASAPPLGRAARLLGAAPWEELLFRVGVYGILVLLTARAAGFLGASRALALGLGEVVAILGSSLAFAAFHLEAVQVRLGSILPPEGVAPEPDGAAFLWRLVAGLLLAGIFRWRGLGTAAWAHGLFNLGLALGAAPNVFL